MAGVDIVRRFRHLRALVIGDVMLDSYLEGDAARLCSEGPVPVVRKTAEERVPGGAGNCAANLRALGAEVILLGIVGSDVSGRLVRDALRERGVDDQWLVEDPTCSTLHKLRVLANDQYVVRFDSGETRRPASAAREQLLANLERVFPRCDLVVISDYCYGVLSERLLTRLRRLRDQCPGVLVVDSKDLHRYRHAGATLVTPNHLEARLAVEASVSDDDVLRLPEVERIGRRLLARIDATQAAITLAGDGVLLVDRESSVHIPARSVTGAHDVGAGDSFTAATALALAAGAQPEAAVRIGVTAGAMAVTRPRTAVVQYQELLQEISREDGPEAPHLTELTRQLEEERRRGRTIVFTNGVFDILHAGHVHFLREARRLGDVLVVGVNSDESARRLKGKNRPINQERDRLALVAALDPVDYVVGFDEETPIELIRALRPDLHVKGGDYDAVELPEAEAVRQVGGRVVILPLMEHHSTSEVIDRIVTLALA